MENPKAFLARDVVAICRHMTEFCQENICSSSSLNIQNVRLIYTFLPELLVYLFGTPTARGIIQTNLQSHQELALKNLLGIDNPFFQSLIKLSQYPDYSYILSTESLPDDVRRVLSTGAIQLLPKVYSNCTSASSSSIAHSFDIRTAATTQSNLLPTSLTSEMKIQFNMLQFYLYYFVNLTTWTTTPLNRPPATSTLSNGSLTKPIQPIIQNNLTSTIYSEILDQYLTSIVPVTGNIFSRAGRFFLDALVELWIRTTWISRNSKLNSTRMFFISRFVTFIVKNDLKNYLEDSPTYEAVRDELYMLISRLAINWERSDDYIQVVELWCLWASAWKRGAPIRSVESEIYQPVQRGWVPFILDNIPYYFSMVEIFFDRTSQFSYSETSTTISLSGQLRILYRIMNVFKGQGLVELLDQIEQALNMASVDSFYIKRLAVLACKSEMDVKTSIRQASLRLAQLDDQLSWKSKNIYTQDPKRFPPLIQTLTTLHEAISRRESSTWGLSKKPSRHLEQLQEAYKLLIHLFRLQNYQFVQSAPTSPLDVNLTQIQYAGLQNGGFLTPEELEKIKEGKMMCSSHSIPAMGRRIQTVIRSYENPTLVLWSIYLDRKINETYNAWLPAEYRAIWFPSTLTTRPFANNVNFIYTCAFLFLLSYLLSKILL